MKQINKTENIIDHKAYNFALSIIKLYKNMRRQNEFINTLISESEEIIAILTSIAKTSQKSIKN